MIIKAKESHLTGVQLQLPEMKLNQLLFSFGLFQINIQPVNWICRDIFRGQNEWRGVSINDVDCSARDWCVGRFVFGVFQKVYQKQAGRTGTL
jgi:hypothetical protein